MLRSPKALFFQLRTVREDYAAVRKQASAAAATRSEPTVPPAPTPAQAAGGAATDAQSDSLPNSSPDNPKPTSEEINTASEAKSLPEASSTPQHSTPHPQPNPLHPDNGNNRGIRHPWEYVDEISAILKTAFPLLAPTLEQMVEQIGARFKPTQEEEIYRFISALLTEAIYVRSRSVGDLPSAYFWTVANCSTECGSWR